MSHVIVCGLGRFGLRVVRVLRRRGLAVTVITSPSTRADRKDEARRMGALLIEDDFRFPAVREEARLTEARALILASSDDGANLATALDVRDEAPGVRIVMRRRDEALSALLEGDFGIGKVLAPPTLAAPAFVEAALDAPLPERPAGRPQRRPTPPPHRYARDPLLLALSLAVLFFAGVLVFRLAMDLSLVDAAYFTATTLTTVGFGDFNLQNAAAPVKVFGIFLMFSGVFLIAALSSILTNLVVSGALARRRAEWAARRRRDHVIVCGLGTVGRAIAHDLRRRGRAVVAIDSAPVEDEAREVAAHIPLLIGDATRAEVLLRAGLDRARALVAAVSEDEVNLQIGMNARALVEEVRPDRPLRLVLRCFDPELARGVHALSANYVLLSTAEIAAPLCVAYALEENPPGQGS